MVFFEAMLASLATRELYNRKRRQERIVGVTVGGRGGVRKVFVLVVAGRERVGLLDGLLDGLLGSLGSGLRGHVVVGRIIVIAKERMQVFRRRIRKVHGRRLLLGIGLCHKRVDILFPQFFLVCMPRAMNTGGLR